MKYRAKIKVSEGSPYPAWVEGRYITDPPTRPGSREKRPRGHYIDKGGYPGANVYAINIDTLCRESKTKDMAGRPVFEDDLVRFIHLDKSGNVIYSYCVAVVGSSGELEIVDILTGEIMQQNGRFKLKVIGNVFDHGSFIDDIERVYENSGGCLPYIPAINVQYGNYPYWRLKCRRCGRVGHGVLFTTTCRECGGFVECTLATEIQKESLSG